MSTEFYFNAKTKQVEQGPQSDYTNRMGPYASREEAEAALQTAKSRNESWDEEDQDWNGQGA